MPVVLPVLEISPRMPTQKYSAIPKVEMFSAELVFEEPGDGRILDQQE
jgi:hypothetical protein